MRYTKYSFPVPDEKLVRVITDTDANNEADDQFAIVQALLSPKFINVALVAAHYGNRRYEDSMERSYAELERITSLMGINEPGLILHGGAHALTDTSTPVESEGARKIVEEAMKQSEYPLYVILFGPLTDLASAYLMEPRIAGRLTAIWIGGNSYPHGGGEFNMNNDINAANVVFCSKLDVWQVPKNVYEMMPVSLAELELKVAPCGKIGKYLCDQMWEHIQSPAARSSAFRTGETWVLGDSPAVGLLLYEHRYEFKWMPAPIVDKSGVYIHTGMNRPIRVYQRIDPRLILDDLFAKLALFARNNPDL